MIQYTWDVNRTNHQLQLIGHDCEYHYDEADVETISYLLKMSPQKKNTYKFSLKKQTFLFILPVFLFSVYKPAAY